MLLSFPMALNPFVTMQEKGFSMSYLVVINAKLNLLICFFSSNFDVILNEGCFFKLEHPFQKIEIAIIFFGKLYTHASKKSRHN